MEQGQLDSANTGEREQGCNRRKKGEREEGEVKALGLLPRLRLHAGVCQYCLESEEGTPRREACGIFESQCQKPGPGSCPGDPITKCSSILEKMSFLLCNVAVTNAEQMVQRQASRNPTLSNECRGI